MMILSVEVQIIQPLYFPNDIWVGISPSKKKNYLLQWKSFKNDEKSFLFQITLGTE